MNHDKNLLWRVLFVQSAFASCRVPVSSSLTESVEDCYTQFRLGAAVISSFFSLKLVKTVSEEGGRRKVLPTRKSNLAAQSALLR